MVGVVVDGNGAPLGQRVGTGGYVFAAVARVAVAEAKARRDVGLTGDFVGVTHVVLVPGELFTDVAGDDRASDDSASHRPMSTALRFVGTTITFHGNSLQSPDQPSAESQDQESNHTDEQDDKPIHSTTLACLSDFVQRPVTWPNVPARRALRGSGSSRGSAADRHPEAVGTSRQGRSRLASSPRQCRHGWHGVARASFAECTERVGLALPCLPGCSSRRAPRPATMAPAC